ncbi:MAG: DUF805 domain-containing protein [Candidatus Competibacter sp.]|nr:DUF805 domain-containing protein [Candidatus Competibacter sp.]
MTDASPYRPPRGAITPTTSTDYGEINLLSSQGRLGRVRYIGYSVGLGLLINVIAGLLGGAGAFLGEGGGDWIGWVGGGAVVVLALAALVVSVMLAIQRLHDFDASGWWSVLVAVPFANLVLYLVLLIMPGTQGPNRFGNPPPPNTLGVTILALVLPLIFVIGIVAAIAIPAYQHYLERAQATGQHDSPSQR